MARGIDGTITPPGQHEADGRRFLHRVSISFLFFGLTMFILNALTCEAALYRWSDQAGIIHFSDSLPVEDVPQEQLNLVDPAQRPLLKKPLKVYQDNVFRVMLTAEDDDSVQFDVIYTEIHRTFPEIIRCKTKMYLCAVSREVTSYLTYTVVPVEGGSATLRLTNRLSKHSPSRLQTETLNINLFYRDPETNEDRALFSKEIPFGKVWEKRADGVY